MVPFRLPGLLPVDLCRFGTARQQPVKEVAARPLDLDTGKSLGLLLGATESCDVVDALVASLVRAGDRVLTSDPDGLRRLLDALSVDASVASV